MDIFDLRWDIVWNYRDMFIRGIGVTLILTLSGYFGGILLGLFLGLGKLSSKNGFIGHLNYISIYSVEHRCLYKSC